VLSDTELSDSVARGNQRRVGIRYRAQFVDEAALDLSEWPEALVGLFERAGPFRTLEVALLFAAIVLFAVVLFAGIAVFTLEAISAMF
jgi:hypothetical protein